MTQLVLISLSIVVSSWNVAIALSIAATQPSQIDKIAIDSGTLQLAAIKCAEHKYGRSHYYG